MPRLRECSKCGDEFDLDSPAKRQAMGLISHCPECAVEQEVPVLAASSGDGKGVCKEFMKFGSLEDRTRYKRWRDKVSGMHKGKDCQLNGSYDGQPHVRFTTVSLDLPTNHKGKAT